MRSGRRQLWTQDTASVNGTAAPAHRFGFALAAGDADRDGRDELAIGIPGGTVGGAPGAGAAIVLYGTRGGLRAARDQLWSQGARGIKGAAEPGDQLGWALAMGDVDQDGDTDLVIGIPLEDVGGVRDAGAVQVLYGGRCGLRAADELVHQGSRGIKGGPEAGDRFGSALVARDFERVGEDDVTRSRCGSPIVPAEGPWWRATTRLRSADARISRMSVHAHVRTPRRRASWWLAVRRRLSRARRAHPHRAPLPSGSALELRLAVRPKPRSSGTPGRREPACRHRLAGISSPG